MAFLLLLAQNEISLTSATGWGAFGLVVVILGWLAFYHLPSKDKQQSEMLDKHGAAMEKKDAQVMKVLSDHGTESERQRNAFAMALDKVVNHCKEESSALWTKLDEREKRGKQ